MYNSNVVTTRKRSDFTRADAEATVAKATTIDDLFNPQLAGHKNGHVQRKRFVKGLSLFFTQLNRFMVTADIVATPAVLVKKPRKSRAKPKLISEDNA